MSIMPANYLIFYLFNKRTLVDIFKFAQY